MNNNNSNNQWWGELKHGGMLISPALLNKNYNELITINSYQYELIRDSYLKFKANLENKFGKNIITNWVDYIIERILGFSIEDIQKGNDISSDSKFKTLLGKSLYPNRVIAENGIPKLFIKICDDKQIGIGKGKRNFAEFLELLRENQKVSLGIITNGEQIRLCHVGSGHEAWVEWNVENWFIEEEFRNQLYGFITLVSKKSLFSYDTNQGKLIDTINESRKKQGELSSVLGEQVREAVELLISCFEITLKENDSICLENNFSNSKKYYDSIYQAASRIVMRMVILFFAESRGMLPRDIPMYNASYGLEGLYEQLRMAATHEGKKSLKNQFGAWRRILSLFRLVYDGSGHQLITLQAYGGELFRGGDISSNDDILKVLSIFENSNYKLSDYDILVIIEKLKVGKIKIKEGNKFIWVNGPVDFSDIRTEYIGIMYEGLLDYSLQRAKETMLVLNVGDEPVLPLNHLELLRDNEIKQLFKEYKTEDITSIDENYVHETEDEVNNEAIEIQRVNKWSLRVVETLKLVKKNKSMDEYDYKRICSKEAEKLIAQIYEKGDYYLVKAGGIRKGTGTYYTKPGLTIPTVKRTLEPLLYDIEDNELVPKLPEKILSLKVCDPACGSGSFLVAATEYISDVLTESILYHGRFEKKSSDKTRIMPYATRSKGYVEEETLSVPPESEHFEEHLRARLMRYVVERCIYGVDINPMAVELARLSLWIDTMNDELPFTFLDHKIKQGNALVGANLSSFRHYPIQAFSREGGDSEHSNGVKYQKKEWTTALKGFLNSKIKPEMVTVIEGFQGINQLSFENDNYYKIDHLEDSINEVSKIFEEFHQIPMSASGIRKREQVYREKIIDNVSIAKLKFEFDKWCSVWFWPIDKLEICPSPLNYNNLNEVTIKEINKISKEHCFFHWELEYPDVFASKKSGFDAIIGNPPWNIAKPNSVEFFSYYDPLYRSYGKQEALKKQKDLFNENSNIERLWLIENSNSKAMSNWVQNVSSPFGYDDSGSKLISLVKNKKDSILLHEAWNTRRKLDNFNSRGNIPFSLQGSSDINLYKLFVEQGKYLLNSNGRIGIIVPAGIYSDKGTIELRKYFIDNMKWEWLFAFENREKIFNIHSSFKFAIIILTNGEESNYIKTSFMNRKIEDWEKLNVEILDYSVDIIRRLSPYNFAFLELQDKKNLKLIDKIYINSSEFDTNVTSEFHMTSSSHLFIRFEDFDRGTFIDKFGIVHSKNKKYYPLLQGSSIEQMDAFARVWNYENKEWINNKNNRLIAQYYISEEDWKIDANVKLLFRDVSNSTNTRTFIGALVPGIPSGNTLNKIISDSNLIQSIIYNSVMNSFVFDYVLRNKMVGTHINGFIVKELPIINIDDKVLNSLIINSAKINFNNIIYSTQWIHLLLINKIDRNYNIFLNWAITKHEKIRIRCIIDSIIAYSAKLTLEEFRYILSDNKENPKGFWRVDKEKDIKFRQTELTLIAYKDLLNRGIEEFINNEWRLPAEVAEYYGQQFLDWQLEKSAEEAWRECDSNAKEYLGEELYEEFKRNLLNKQVEI